MSVTEGRRELYENLQDEDKIVIDEAFLAVRRIFGKAGYRIAGNDIAENLVGALTRYLKDSGNFQ